jgi:uncharacterized metal-binding protein YceD (DUF177 family)
MSQNAPSATTYRVADLPQNRPTVFEIRPPAETLAGLAADLDLIAIKKLTFSGEIHSFGKNDWELVGTLGATVSQPCVVTLDPVITRIDENIERRFLANMPDLITEDNEVEMPEDEDAEPLKSEIDLLLVIQEALALNIPQFPRAAGAELKESVFTEAGKKAMTDEDARPFAGLAALRNSLSAKDGE